MATADAYPFPTQPAPLRFAVALAAVGIVFVLDSAFNDLIDDGSHSCCWARRSWRARGSREQDRRWRRPSLGALLGAIGRPGLADAARATQTHLALFVVQGLLLTALVSELRRARRVAEQQASDAHEARRESEAAARMKDEFLATISHELRTPLNSVLGWLHLLRTGKLDAATATRGLESIERNVRLQAQLTGDLLDVSKVLTGKLRLDSRPVSLADASRQAVAAAAPAAQAKGVHVTAAIPESSVPVLGDPDAAAPDRLAPARQCDQVHAAGRRRWTDGRRRGRRGEADRVRQRSRDRSRVPAAHLRPVHAGGSVADAHRGRAGRRALAGAGSRRAARRRDSSRQQRGRARRGVHDAVPAARPWRPICCHHRLSRSTDSRSPRPLDGVRVLVLDRGCRRPRARCARSCSNAGRSCGRRIRLPTRSRRSRPGGPTCWSATAHAGSRLVCAGREGSVARADSRRPHPGGGADGIRADRRAGAADAASVADATCRSRSSRRCSTAEIARLTGRERRSPSAVSESECRCPNLCQQHVNDASRPASRSRPTAPPHARVWAPAANWSRSCSTAIAREPGGCAGRSDGYFAASCQASEAGDRYWLRLDGLMLRPDPASRYQPDGPHGPSDGRRSAGIRLDRRELARHRARRARSSTRCTSARSRPKAPGGPRAAQLDALADLGITVVEMMPVADFPGRFGWGYDGVNLCADRLYGTPDDLRAFVDRAHALGIGVILDVVYNHSVPTATTLADFSPDYFTDSYKNDWGRALNFEGPQAHATIFVENAAYWIDEFHFDGLRLDATQDIHDASPEHVIATIVRRAREAARHAVAVHRRGERAAGHAARARAIAQAGTARDALWNDDYHHTAVVALTGKREAYYLDYRGSPQELVSCAKYGYLYQGQWYAWQKQRRGTPALDLPPTAFVVYLENHDQVANTAFGRRLHQTALAGAAARADGADAARSGDAAAVPGAGVRRVVAVSVLRRSQGGVERVDQRRTAGVPVAVSERQGSGSAAALRPAGRRDDIRAEQARSRRSANATAVVRAAPRSAAAAAAGSGDPACRSAPAGRRGDRARRVRAAISGRR